MIRKYFRLKHFAEWVANYIFDCDCEDDVFAELACRKLKELKIIDATDTEWIRYGQQCRFKELCRLLGEPFIDLFDGMISGIKWLFKRWFE